MGKIYGLFGSMKGKIGDVVMAVRNGEQIVRKYQPIVSNPKTEAQVASRAKLKLLSQLGAALQPVIAIPRVGTMSPRNGFTQANYPKTTFENNLANLALDQVQLTKSSIPLGTLVVDRTGGQTMSVYFNDNLAASVDAVVYVVLRRTGDDKVAVVNSKMVKDAGQTGTFETTLPIVTGDIIVLAYGIRYNTNAARTIFGNIIVDDAPAVAKILTTRTLTMADASMTETVGVFLVAGQ